jgi:hypothetical protein
MYFGGPWKLNCCYILLPRKGVSDFGLLLVIAKVTKSWLQLSAADNMPTFDNRFEQKFSVEKNLSSQNSFPLTYKRLNALPWHKHLTYEQIVMYKRKQNVFLCCHLVSSLPTYMRVSMSWPDIVFCFMPGASHHHITIRIMWFAPTPHFDLTMFILLYDIY